MKRKLLLITCVMLMVTTILSGCSDAARISGNFIGEVGDVFRYLEFSGNNRVTVTMYGRQVGGTYRRDPSGFLWLTINNFEEFLGRPDNSGDIILNTMAGGGFFKVGSRPYRLLADEARRDANQGIAGAQFTLGMLYFHVQGNDRQAFAWLSKAADQDYAKAQFWLGILYALGKGAAKDEAKAIEYFKLAAQQGHKHAQEMLINIQGRR